MYILEVRLNSPAPSVNILRYQKASSMAFSPQLYGLISSSRLSTLTRCSGVQRLESSVFSRFAIILLYHITNSFLFIYIYIIYHTTLCCQPHNGIIFVYRWGSTCLLRPRRVFYVTRPSMLMSAPLRVSSYWPF